MNALEIIGAVATMLAVFGVVLNNRKCIWCFAVFSVSNTLTAYIHYSVEVWTVFARDLIFLMLAAEGAWRWSRDRKRPPP